MGMYRSKEDELAKLSSSIFVTNFPDKFSAKELWTVCKQYGTVVDAFIPDRRSKAGKRFGFVRFIKIFDVDRLVNNLCTIWVGRFKLHANIARFQRHPLNKNNSQSSHNKGDQSAPKDFYKESGENVNSKSYAHVVNAGPHQFHKKEDSPAIVLDETYANKTDYSLALLGKVKDFTSLTNLNVVLANEGFVNVKLKYMGGFWVMIVFTSEGAKETFRSKVGIGSWFAQLLQASNSFFVDERVTWIDIEGIPLKVWSKNTFSRITSKWGELLDFDEQEDGYLHSKRVCIKTTLVENIYESFKVIIQGKTFWIRAKEVSGWMPDFEEDIDQDSKSDDELSNEGSFDENGGLRITPNVEGESDLEEVAETIFEKEQASVEVKEETDVDAQKNASKVLDMEGDNYGHKVQDVEQESVTKNNSPLNSYKNVTERSTCSGLAQKVKKDWVRELCEKQKVNFVSLQETKMEDIEFFNIKLCWGNFGFEFVHSPSVGNSGGEWAPNGKKLIIISVYAPQELREKKMLWDYLILVLKSWNGDVIIMGDFNEVRTQDERHGSIFNAHGADAFNLFISSARLEEVPLDGRWIEYPILVKDEFLSYFASHFNKPLDYRLHIDLNFPNKLSLEQQMVLEIKVTHEEIKKAVWDYGVDKSPRPDGFTICIYRDIGLFMEKCDRVEAVSLYFVNHRGSVIVNGNVTKEFQFHRGLKAKMTRFFHGHWAEANIDTILRVLDCFYHASGLRINMLKSKLMGILVSSDKVDQAAKKIGCAILQVPFSYLGSLPIYHMSLFKVPAKVLLNMESIRCHFFNGIEHNGKKPIWVKWNKVLASKEKEAGTDLMGSFTERWQRELQELEAEEHQYIFQARED
ncbi:nucleotide-binding alpha-beta plait domain-containing protein [Tanacetum coccineum]